jgi:hypothetical protein
MNIKSTLKVKEKINSILEEMKRLLNKDHLALQAVFGK